MGFADFKRGIDMKKYRENIVSGHLVDITNDILVSTSSDELIGISIF